MRCGPAARRRRAARLLIAAAACFPGCAVGPDYAPPAPALPATWSTIPAGAETRAEAIGAWWEELGDASLTQLIHRAIAGNLDVRAATGRVEEARALYGVESSIQYPTVDADGAITYQRQSENGILPGGESDTLYTAGLSASWEVDLFGRVRRAVEAARASAQAAEEDRSDVLVSVCAEVASTYVNLRTLQRRLAVASANLASQAQIVELTRVRREGGIASSLDVAQAESVYANTQTFIPPLEAFIERELNRLGVLVGEPPRALAGELSAVAAIPELPPALALELPVDLVRQRPDIRRAERELAAQTALVGVAVGDLYPRLTLLGSFGFDATDASRLFTAASQSYSAGPSLRWNVFAGGRLRALVRAQEARTGQALARYESTVLQALEEVEDALVTFDRLRRERLAVAEAVRAASRSLELSTALYKDGVADFQNVLDAQRVVLQFEDTLTRIDGAVVQGLIQIYRALGGGWRALEPAPGMQDPQPPPPQPTEAHE